jgi:CBS-domain-containing membrane protein
MLKSKSPLKRDAKMVFCGFAGGFLTILLLSFMHSIADTALFMPPFGASCVLTFAAWEAPLAQPRNVIGGHFIASVVGIVVSRLLGNQPVSLAIAVGLAIALMVLTKTIHPPAGATPLAIILGNSGVEFLLFPVLTGSLILVAMSVLFNRLVFKRDYPKFWF